MDVKEFLDEMCEEDFPTELGREMRKNDHDPPFTQKELRGMARLGVISLDTKNWTFRLTMKATRIKESDRK